MAKSNCGIFGRFVTKLCIIYTETATGGYTVPKLANFCFISSTEVITLPIGNGTGGTGTGTGNGAAVNSSFNNSVT